MIVLWQSFTLLEQILFPIMVLSLSVLYIYVGAGLSKYIR